MDRKWWHGAVAYQIYPKSFQDSNQDGIGDLKGIIRRLDYLKELHVDILWLSPIYVSPFVDEGYDIADYQAIAPVFGTMEDFDELLREAKARGMELIMDLVLNHCSSEHPWFKQALSSPLSEEASFFYFRRGHDGLPPDNLRSYFGGSVWEKIEGDSDLYYLHYFAREQPDLNWYNEKLRERLFEMMNWWLDKGVAGFRVDAIMNIAKDLSFPGLPADGADGLCAASKMTARMAGEVSGFLKEMRDKTLKPHDAFSVGEAFSVREEDLAAFIGEDGCFSTIFDFSSHGLNEGLSRYCDFKPLTVKYFRDATFTAQEKANAVGFLAPIIENHDEPRGVSAILPRQWQNARGAQALGTVTLLLRGIPFIYQGQELGMANTHFDSVYEIRDLLAREQYSACLKQGLSPYQALTILNCESRENARTPMLWDHSSFAGFSEVTPWLKVHQDQHRLCVEFQEGDPHSTLNHYRALTALKHHPDFRDTLTYGDFERMPCPDDDTICFRRVGERQEIGVIASFSHDTHVFPIGEAKILLTSGEVSFKEGELMVKPGSSAVFIIER